MKQSDNRFERIRDGASKELTRLAESADRFFGTDKRPYGTRKLTGQDKRDYYELMLTPGERLQFLDEIGPEGWAKFQRQTGIGEDDNART